MAQGSCHEVKPAARSRYRARLRRRPQSRSTAPMLRAKFLLGVRICVAGFTVLLPQCSTNMLCAMFPFAFKRLKIGLRMFVAPFSLIHNMLNFHRATVPSQETHVPKPCPQPPPTEHLHLSPCHRCQQKMIKKARLSTMVKAQFLCRPESCRCCARQRLWKPLRLIKNLFEGTQGTERHVGEAFLARSLSDFDNV